MRSRRACSCGGTKERGGAFEAFAERTPGHSLGLVVVRTSRGRILTGSLILIFCRNSAWQSIARAVALPEEHVIDSSVGVFACVVKVVASHKQ
jgi:hypothetical protein